MRRVGSTKRAEGKRAERQFRVQPIGLGEGVVRGRRGDLPDGQAGRGADGGAGAASADNTEEADLQGGEAIGGEFRSDLYQIPATFGFLFYYDGVREFARGCDFGRGVQWRELFQAEVGLAT